MKQINILSLFLIVLSAATGGATTVDFSLGASGFSASTYGAAYNLTPSASGGLAGTASIQVGTNTAANIWTYNTSNFTGTTANWSVGVYFKPVVQTTFPGGSISALIASVGVFSAIPSGVYAQSDLSLTSINSPNAIFQGYRLLLYRDWVKTGSTNGVVMRIANVLDAGSATDAPGPITNQASFNTYSLVDNNWYYIQLSGAYQGGGTTDLTGQIFTSDANGNLGSEMFNTTMSGATNASISGDLYGFFGGGVPTSLGISTFDNFEVVPEPSSVSLMFFCAVGAISGMRRRKPQG